jgi:rubrerythrin
MNDGRTITIFLNSRQKISSSGSRGRSSMTECIVCGSAIKKNQNKCPNCGASQTEDDDY